MPRDEFAHLQVVEQAVNVMTKVESYISVGMELTIDVVSDFGEYEKGTDGDCEETLKDLMKDYIKMERDFKQFIEATKYTKQKIEEGDDIATMEDLLHARVEELKSGNDDSVFANHDKYMDLVDKIQEVRNTESTSNPELLATEDEDVEMTQKNIVTKCPYTGQEMMTPVRNKICGHNYEREGIADHISKRKHKARCPVSGCPNQQVLTMADMEENKDLRRIIERRRRQAGQRLKR